jgi:hypothetical protein
MIEDAFTGEIPETPIDDDTPEPTADDFIKEIRPTTSGDDLLQLPPKDSPTRVLVHMPFGFGRHKASKSGFRKRDLTQSWNMRQLETLLEARVWATEAE